MILEALLDWGWIVIIFSGIVWAFFAPRTVTDKTKVNAGLAVAAAVLAFMGGILITTQSRASVPNILTAWGSSFQDCGGQVDTTKLVGFKNKYHLVMVCGVSNPRVDPYEDTQIAITTPFTITGQLTTMDTGIGKMSEILDAVPVGTGVSVWHSIALLPMSVEASEIKRVSDFEKRGGIVVTDPKAGGFQQTMGKPVPPAKATEVPPTSSPKQ